MARIAKKTAGAVVKKAVKTAAATAIKSGIEKMADVVKKEKVLLEAQEAFNQMGMPQLATAAKAIELTRRAMPGKVLPVFAGSNRKVSIEATATGQTTTSVYGYKYNEKAIPRKTGDINNIVRKNSRYTLTNALNNTQGAADICLLACSNLSSGTDNYTNVTYQEMFETLFNVSGEIPEISVPSSARDQNRVVLDRFESELTLVNPANQGSIQVTVYDLQPKRDLPKAVYSSRNYATGLMSPMNTWQTGLTNEVMLEDTVTPYVPGQEPTTNLKFNTFWKVMKRTRVQLSPGSTHIHRSYNILNTLFNYYDYSEVLGMRAGLCPTQIIVYSGMPDETYLTTAATLVVSAKSVLYGRSSVNDNITVRNYDSSIT